MFKRIFIILFLILFFAGKGLAGWKPTISSSIGAANTCGTTFNTTTGNTVHTWDADFQTYVYPSPGSYQDNNVINKVILGINRNCTGPFNFTPTATYDMEVDVLVQYLTYSQATTWLAGGHSLPYSCTGPCIPITRSSFTKTLKITYNPNYQALETELSTFSFTGGYDIEVTVQAIRWNGAPAPLSMNNVYLENSIIIERYQDFNTSSPAAPSFTANPTLPLEEGTLSFPALAGAENYDVEWVFLDWESGYAAGFSGLDRKFEFDFRHNATRVNIKTTSVNVPLIYPKGIILFRVRGNGTVLPVISTLETGTWSGSESGIAYLNAVGSGITGFTVGSFTPVVYGYYHSGFSPGITWQHSMVLAEEGKRKQVISYYDGSLYNRQSVTKNNSDNQAIVGQTVYDFNGRPAVQILPVPVPSTTASDQSFAYKPLFNQTSDALRSGDAYSYKDFDPDYSGDCVDTKTNRLSSTSGTAKYYSSNNPFTSTNITKLPDAEGYAFTQTEYTPDNTGRVRRQGGVGAKHRLTGKDDANTNQQGKETQYFYGVPTQVELDRLFGNEAGDARRYKKNIVIDPNGQASVSYLDPMGRVVATSLAGNPSSNSPNVSAVAGRSPVTVSVDLIKEKNEWEVEKVSITTTYSHMVYNDNTLHKFQYRIALPMLTYVCGENSFCYDCVYDLTLSVKDANCQMEYVPLDFRSNKVGLPPPDGHDCGSDSIVFSTGSAPLEITLNKGDYIVTKTLTIDKHAMEDYFQDLINSPYFSSCITPYSTLLDDEKSKLDYTSCDYTCEECYAEANSLLSAEKITSDEYDKMMEGCSTLCYKTTPCDALFDQMIADMSPGGQYFDNIQKGDLALKLENDQIDEIVPDNTWLDATYSMGSYTFFGPTGTLTLKLQQHGIMGIEIDNWDDVRNNWMDTFAEMILEMHPEYCMYEACKCIEDSYRYDQDMEDIETYSQASSQGFYNPTGLNITMAKDFSTNNDPFFSTLDATCGTGTYKTDFENTLTGYKVVESSTLNAWEFVDYVVGLEGSDINGCLSDYGWNMFRAIYLGEKFKVLKQYYTDHCPDVTVAKEYERRFKIFEDEEYEANFGSGFTIPSSTDPNDYRNLANSYIEDNCEKACSAYIDQWKRELVGCSLTTVEMDAVIANLLEVCQGGCDAYDPAGSRYVKPGVTTTYKTFRQALGTHYNPNVCDDLLLQWPRGSYHDYWAENTPYVNRCGCLPNQEAPDPPLSCTGCEETLTPNGEHLFENVQLAGKKKCKNCITCINMAETLKELEDQQGITFTLATEEERRIMENYFNLKFGFNLTYLEYMDFMRDCIGASDWSTSTIGDFRDELNNNISNEPIEYTGMMFSALSLGGDSTGGGDSTYYGGGESDSTGFSDSLGGGGFEALSFSTPPGTAPLDKCACELLFEAKAQYDAYVAATCPTCPPCIPCAPPGLSFKDFLDGGYVTGAPCEGAWGSLDVDALLAMCQDAVGKDADNPYTGPGFAWTFIQLNDLQDAVDFDMNNDQDYLIPAGCACSSTPPDDNTVVNVVHEECGDCYLQALEDYLKFLDDHGCTFNLDGSPVSKGDLYDFLTQERINQTDLVYNAGTSTYEYTYHYSPCALLISPWMFPAELARTDFNLNNNSCYPNVSFADFLAMSGCNKNQHGDILSPPPPPPPNTWPFWDPYYQCPDCMKPDRDLLTASLKFLNELTALYNTSNPKAGNILTASGWYVSSLASSYLDPELYSGGCSSFLKYKLLSWFNNLPTPSVYPSSISFRISDASGGGGCTHQSDWTLTFPTYDPDFKFTYITEFTEILAAPRTCGDNTRSFLVGVKVLKPNSTEVEVKYLMGTISDKYIYEDDPTHCKRLCNKPILPDAPETTPCQDFLDEVAATNAANRQQEELEALRKDFVDKYAEKCLSIFEYFNMEYELDEYHHTLYYYDQADNLIKTVPPKGVVLLSQASIDSAQGYREGAIGISRVKPNHNYITNYKYNTLNLSTEQFTPDGGTSHFWYDRLGRLILSQNAKQAAAVDYYSYTQYDNLGRITEVGEVFIDHTSVTVSTQNTADPSWVATNITGNTAKTQITVSVYDAAAAFTPTISGFTQINLRNRISSTFYYDAYQANPADYNHATHYSYDALGNVHHLVQDIPELGLDAMGQQFKHILYNYDLASGKVNLVSYQPGQTDQFFHYYTYDADNRVTAAYTSRNPAVYDLDMARSTPDFIPTTGWQRDEKYFYHPHGAIARTELGQNQVQGTDYSFTLHGWMKAVNAGFMQNDKDPGLDGNIPAMGTNPNRWVGRDVIGLELGYYSGDYTAIGNNNHLSSKTGSDFITAITDMYNGNISHAVTTIPDKTQIASNVVQAAPVGSAYSYDQLNRLKQSLNYTNCSTVTNTWLQTLMPGSYPDDWKMSLNYDPNGNITGLTRNGPTGALSMDNLTYHYDDLNWKNQQTYVDDGVSSGAHTEDIDDQSSGNYTYDDIGNLTSDAAEEIGTIEWTVYGKIKSITRTGGSTKPNLEFEYNTIGQRVLKRVLPNNGDKPEITYYLRDASGNIMATYRKYYEVTNALLGTTEDRFAVQEFDIYGNKRTGILNTDKIISYRIGVWSGGAFVPGMPADFTVNSYSSVFPDVYGWDVGNKSYELSNHLGNVLATITDRKVPNISSGSFTYFNAQVTTVTDYYPFGMQIEERTWQATNTKYRFGMNGQEKDDEISGAGNSMTAEYWEYNTRLCRRWNLDPLTFLYSNQSPYVTFDNNPVFFVDILGLAAQDWIKKKNGDVVNDKTIYTQEQATTVHGAGTVYLGKKNVYYEEETMHHWVLNEDGTKEDIGKYEVGVPPVEVFPEEKAADMVTRRKEQKGSSPDADFYVGNVFTILEHRQYSKELGLWRGKNGKFYDFSFNGNQHTGGRNKYALNNSKLWSRLGKVVGYYGVYKDYKDWLDDKMDGQTMLINQASNLFSIYGSLPGAAWGVGWELGKHLIPDDSWYARNIRPKVAAFLFMDRIHAMNY